MLDTALGSGVNDPPMDVGDVWKIDGAPGVANGIAATATLGRTRIMPIANTKVLEIRRTGAQSPYLAATSPSRMCPRANSIRAHWSTR